jgi:hypothetical protein
MEDIYRYFERSYDLVFHNLDDFLLNLSTLDEDTWRRSFQRMLRSILPYNSSREASKLYAMFISGEKS